jgi:hypothetical protein
MSFGNIVALHFCHLLEHVSAEQSFALEFLLQTGDKHLNFTPFLERNVDV